MFGRRARDPRDVRRRPAWVRRARNLAIVAAAAYAGIVLLASQWILAPSVRPTVAGTDRPVLGVVLRDDPAGTRIVRAVPPASEAGLRGGDRIVAVDGAPHEPWASTGIAAHVARAVEGQLVRIEAERVDAAGRPVAVWVDVPVAVRPITPFDQGLPYEDVAFDNEHGTLLRAWYIPPPPGSAPAPAVAYGHGNASDRRAFLRIAWDVHRAGLGQVLLDHGGRGESDGDRITLGFREATDLVAALRFLAARPEIDGERLALGGRSMGAAAAAIAAGRAPAVRAVVLDSAYTDLSGLLDDVLASYWLPPILFRRPIEAVVAFRERFEPSEVRPIDGLAASEAAVLLFHGDRDDIVPYDHALALRETLGDRADLVTLEGLGHNSPRPDDYADRIARFLRRHTR